MIDHTLSTDHPPAPPTPAPVFVDASGRRQRRVRRAGRILAVPAAGYLALLASSALGGPTLDAPFLPGNPARTAPAPAAPPETPTAAATTTARPTAPAAPASPTRGVTPTTRTTAVRTPAQASTPPPQPRPLPPRQPPTASPPLSPAAAPPRPPDDRAPPPGGHRPADLPESEPPVTSTIRPPAARRARRTRRGRRRMVRQVPLRTHWLLLTALVLTLAAALLLQGYTQHMYGHEADGAAPARGGAASVPEQVRTGGPVIDASGAQPRTAGPAAGTLALTFDDGPDPEWTPKILDVLRRHHVRATFFVVGTQVAAHPELARRIVAEGHQIGIHTFTHADLAAAPAWRRSLELREAQAVVAGATGVTTPLLRPRTPRRTTHSPTPAGRPSGKPAARVTSPCSPRSTARTGAGPAPTGSWPAPPRRAGTARSC